MKDFIRSLRLSKIFNSATFGDKVLFALLVFLAVSGFFFIKVLLPSTGNVIISADNKTAYTLSLDEDRIVSVTGPIGDNVIEVRDGKVHMVEAPCAQKLCIRQGWINRGAIICLPNKVAATVSSRKESEDSSEYDAVTR